MQEAPSCRRVFHGSGCRPASTLSTPPSTGFRLPAGDSRCLFACRLQADIELFLQGGLAILRKIEQCGYNVWARRPTLAKWEKGLLLAGTLWRRLSPGVRIW